MISKSIFSGICQRKRLTPRAYALTPHYLALYNCDSSMKAKQESQQLSIKSNRHRSPWLLAWIWRSSSGNFKYDLLIDFPTATGSPPPPLRLSIILFSKSFRNGRRESEEMKIFWNFEIVWRVKRVERLG